VTLQEFLTNTYSLTPLEAEVAVLMYEGQRYKEIMPSLGLGIGKMSSITESIYAKVGLGIKQRVQKRGMFLRKIADAWMGQRMNSKEFYALIGHNMRANRKRLGLSQTMLCKKLNKANSYISEVESGKRAVSGFFIYQVEQVIGRILP
jgi:DNA-binding CsgD family transcriptional regulator